jgi:biopolymer transport protein ExbD
MTPFVDVAFLILSFFIMATKFKPQEPVTITTPHSVSSAKLKEQDAALITFDSVGHVYFSMSVQKKEDENLKYELIKNVNQSRNLGLSENEMRNFQKDGMIGSPFAEVKSLLAMPNDQRGRVTQKGIPVDSANNELATWIASAKLIFEGKKADFMIKGDNNAKYPTFKGVIDALRTNDLNKYKLITDPKGAPEGSELYLLRQSGKSKEES